MRIRTILAAAAVPAALAVTLLGATSASASAKPAAYSANAHESGVSDTTNVSGNATQDSPGGPVWALDNLERKLTATQNADGTWAVQISSQGSFSAFASPIDGNTWPGVGASASDNTGSVKGFVNYTVVSATPPSNAALRRHRGPVVRRAFVRGDRGVARRHQLLVRLQPGPRSL